MLTYNLRCLLVRRGGREIKRMRRSLRIRADGVVAAPNVARKRPPRLRRIGGFAELFCWRSHPSSRGGDCACTKNLSKKQELTGLLHKGRAISLTCYHRSLMISLTHVSKVFDGKRKATALHDVNLEIARGQVVSIIGPSGSGKSTLLNLIGGLDRPTAGQIHIEGENLADLSDDDLTRVRRDKIGFVFQFFNLLPTLNCLENVALPLH